MIELNTKLIELHGEVYYQALHIPAASVTTLLKGAKDKRVICRINDTYEWQAALMPLGDGDWFINVSKEVRQRAGIEAGDENIGVRLIKDESEFGMPVPEELVELWAVDEEARVVFATLTPGKQRALLYQIGKPKRSETRIRKAVLIMDYLKSVAGKLDFKELNIYLKENK